MFGGSIPAGGRRNPADGATQGFPGIQRAAENGELRRVQGVEDISEEALNSAPGKNQISLEEAGY